MEQFLYRIKKYSEEALHYPADTFHHKDALRLLNLAIVEFQAAQRSAQRTADHVCLCGVGDPLNIGKDIVCPIHGSR